MKDTRGRSLSKISIIIISDLTVFSEIHLNEFRRWNVKKLRHDIVSADTALEPVLLWLSLKFWCVHCVCRHPSSQDSAFKRFLRLIFSIQKWHFVIRATLSSCSIGSFRYNSSIDRDSFFQSSSALRCIPYIPLIINDYLQFDYLQVIGWPYVEDDVDS